MLDRLKRIRTAWTFVPRDYRGTLAGAVLLLILGVSLAAALVAAALTLWCLAPREVEIPRGAPATDTAVEDRKRDLAAEGANDKATAAEHAAAQAAARDRARTIRRERKVTHDTDTEVVDAVRRAPDALQPRLFREQLDRARASLDEFDRADRERARRRADAGGDAPR